MRPVQLLTAVGVALCVGEPAFADFQIKTGDPAPAPAVTSDKHLIGDYSLVADHRIQPLMQLGPPDAAVARLSGGFNQGSPLADALKLLLPPGWSGYVRPGIDAHETVRWSAGHSWIDDLGQIANQRGLSITVDWNRNAALVDPLPAESQLVPQNGAASGGNSTGPNSPASAPSGTEAAAGGVSVDPAPLSDYIAVEKLVSPPPQLPAPVMVASNGPVSLPAPATGTKTPPSVAAPAAVAPSVAAQQVASADPPLVSEAATASTSVPPVPQMSYADFSVFLSEAVLVDLRGATVHDAVKALMPAGWEIDDSALDARLRNARIDMDGEQSRGREMAELVQHLGIAIYPYPRLRKAVVVPAGTTSSATAAAQ